MALYTELPVYRDTYQLTLKVFDYTREFARDYKFTLGGRHEARCAKINRQHLPRKQINQQNGALRCIFR